MKTFLTIRRSRGRLFPRAFIILFTMTCGYCSIFAPQATAIPLQTDCLTVNDNSTEIKKLIARVDMQHAAEDILNTSYGVHQKNTTDSRKAGSMFEQWASGLMDVLGKTRERNSLQYSKSVYDTTHSARNQHTNSTTPNSTSRIITIPMSVVPPRLQLPGSPRGMPLIVRIVDIHRSHQTLLRRLFGKGTWGVDTAQATTLQVKTAVFSNEKPRKRTYSVDLRGGILGVGEYYSVIKLGTKSIRVQIDTGSSTLAVPVRGCKSCIKKPSRYSVEESKYAKTIPCDSSSCAVGRCTASCPVCSSKGACCSADKPKECGFSLRYADGSAASGSLVTDEMQWGDLRGNVTFGGVLNISPDFERPEVDGILGMAYKSLACNPSCFEPPFDSFVSKGLIDDIFAVCTTATGGKLMLGGYLPKVAKSPPRYVPLYLTYPPRYYGVRLPGYLKVGQEKLFLPSFKSAIVDTGTTLIVTSTRTFAAIRSYFQRTFCDVPEICGEDSWFQSGMCVSLTKDDLSKMPTITFDIGGILDLELSPHDYMLEYKRGSRTYRCVGMMGMDGLGGLVVLGNTLMQRYVTIYDRANNRLGFAEVAPNCGD